MNHTKLFFHVCLETKQAEENLPSSNQTHPTHTEPLNQTYPTQQPQTQPIPHAAPVPSSPLSLRCSGERLRERLRERLLQPRYTSG